MTFPGLYELNSAVSNLDSLTKKSNSALTQYKNIKKDIEAVEIDWNNISQIKENNLGSSCVEIPKSIQTFWIPDPFIIGI